MKQLGAIVALLAIAASTASAQVTITPGSAVNGGGAFTGQLSGPVANCATAPPYSFTGRLTTGLCSPAADSWALIAGGVTTLTGTSTAVASAVPIGFNAGGGAIDTGISRTGAADIAFGNGAAGSAIAVLRADSLILGSILRVQSNSSGITLGNINDVALSRGAADRMDAGANDSWYVPGGGLGVGATPGGAGTGTFSGLVQGAGFLATSTTALTVSGASKLFSTVDGIWVMSNNLSNDFTGLILGTNDANGVRISKNAQTFEFRLGNNSAGANISAAAGTFSGTVTSTSPTSGIGYATGAGGAVTQITSRTTGVTLNTVNGEITLVSAVGSATATSFTVTNSAMAATDHVELNQKSGANKYVLLTTAKAAGSFEITVYTTGGTATEAPVISFAIVKGSAS